MAPNGWFHWDIGEISQSLKITDSDVRSYFTDGRRVSFLLERRIAYEVLLGKLAPSEGAGYDVLDSKGDKWEVRSISRGGIYFCPSFMVGSGRRFNQEGFLLKLQAVVGYVISDIEQFPEIPFWIISASTVHRWWSEGRLGSSSKVSRRQALSLLSSCSEEIT